MPEGPQEFISRPHYLKSQQTNSAHYTQIAATARVSLTNIYLISTGFFCVSLRPSAANLCSMYQPSAGAVVALYTPSHTVFHSAPAPNHHTFFPSPLTFPPFL